MKFYQHAKENNGVRTGSKLLSQHLKGVYNKALSSLYQSININVDNKDINSILQDLTYFHDFGKYTSFFQKYLLGEKVNANLKNHSVIGAVYLLNKYQNNPFYAALLYFLIINHHSSFSNILNTGIFENNIEKNNNNLLRQIEDIVNCQTEIETEYDGLEINSLLKIPDADIQKKHEKNR